jgi:hypothetical protein
MQILGHLALALIPLLVRFPHTVSIPSIGLMAPVSHAECVELANSHHTWSVPCGLSASMIK